MRVLVRGSIRAYSQSQPLTLMGVCSIGEEMRQKRGQELTIFVLPKTVAGEKEKKKNGSFRFFPPRCTQVASAYSKEYLTSGPRGTTTRGH